MLGSGSVQGITPLDFREREDLFLALNQSLPSFILMTTLVF